MNFSHTFCRRVWRKDYNQVEEIYVVAVIDGFSGKITLRQSGEKGTGFYEISLFPDVKIKSPPDHKNIRMKYKEL